MHDKTLILPVVDELEKLINQNAEIELQIGNFTNLNEKTILKYLNNLKFNVEEMELADDISEIVIKSSETIISSIKKMLLNA